MQAFAEKQLRLFGSRLARRVLFCTFCAAVCLFVIGYIITTNAETQAKQDYINYRRQLVSYGLSGLRADLDNQTQGPFEPRLEDLSRLLLQGQLAYIILLDKKGESLLSLQSGPQIGLDEEGLLRLARRNGPAQVFPSQELIALNGAEYLNSVLLLPHSDGLMAVYGLYAAQVQDAGARAAAQARAAVWAGLAALFVLCVLCFVIFLGPLLRLLQYAVARLSGSAGVETPPPESRRKDELGDLARLTQRLLSRQQTPPSAGAKIAELLRSIAPLLEGLEHGVLVMELGGRILASNGLARKILRQDAPLEGQDIFQTLEGVFNPGQRLEFRRRFDRLPDISPGALELACKDTPGLQSYAFHLRRQAVLGADCIFCLIYTICDERQLRQMEAEAAALAEKLVQERTQELVKVNGRLRRENTERRAVEQALVRAESRYREIVNNSIEGIFQLTPDGRLLSANASMARILGYASVEELLEAYAKPGRRICYTEEMELAIVELLDIRGWVSKLEFQALMQDNSSVWVAMNARLVADASGQTMYYEAFIEDITSRKKTEEKLVHQAFHDPLTGLPNRALFLDRLRMALRRSKRHSEYLFAVLYLDLDRFKNVNDRFGHSAGDKILGHATEKLLQCVRDLDTVARFGGDEFAVLLANLEKPAQAVLIAKRISAALSEAVDFHGQDVHIGASIGIVLNNHEYTTPEEVLRDADTAMYRAKMRGRRRCTVFNERMREETMAVLSLESDLRVAVERGQIEAFYQPLVNLENGSVYGFEALMRWRRNQEIVSPAVFIPIAEEAGIIYDLGLDMINIVCQQAVEWTQALGRSDFSLHINISSRQLMATRFWRDVQEVISKTGVNPHQLIFEITESVLLDYGSQVISIMNLVRDFGIRFCLDDFGTGFSSLSYLRILPLESLKVDRSFVVDINTDKYSEVILRNLVAMGRDLGLKVIAEGVEQQQQVEALRLMGCKYAQGFYFSKALPHGEIVKFLRGRNSAAKALALTALGANSSS